MFVCFVFFFFKKKTSYEMRIRDWSSDVCSSDLLLTHVPPCHRIQPDILTGGGDERPEDRLRPGEHIRSECRSPVGRAVARPDFHRQGIGQGHQPPRTRFHARSEEHTSELQSLMRISYAVFCFKKKQKEKDTT